MLRAAGCRPLCFDSGAFARTLSLLEDWARLVAVEGALDITTGTSAGSTRRTEIVPGKIRVPVADADLALLHAAGACDRSDFSA